MTILEMMRPVGEKAKPTAKKSNKKSSTNKVKATPKPVVVDNTMDELHCEAGNHKWQRAKQRGRKPFNCPLHQPEKVTAEITEKSVAKPKSARQNKRNKKNGISVTLADACQTALDSDRISDFDKRAIKYIVNQLADGKREKNDVDLLTKRLNELTKRFH
jgi:hypothetical protein